MNAGFYLQSNKRPAEYTAKIIHELAPGAVAAVEKLPFVRGVMMVRDDAYTHVNVRFEAADIQERRRLVMEIEDAMHEGAKLKDRT